MDPSEQSSDPVIPKEGKGEINLLLPKRFMLQYKSNGPLIPFWLLSHRKQRMFVIQRSLQSPVSS